jgi:hypothetical protein
MTKSIMSKRKLQQNDAGDEEEDVAPPQKSAKKQGKGKEKDTALSKKRGAHICH